MAINYRVSRVKNPKYPEQTYYACKNVKTGDYTFDNLAEDIAESTTVTRADAVAVLEAVRPKVKKALLAGQRVVLDGLGAFNIGIQGKAFDSATMAEEEFSPSSFIRSHRVIFRPEVKLKKEIALGLQLKRIPSEAMA